MSQYLIGLAQNVLWSLDGSCNRITPHITRQRSSVLGNGEKLKLSKQPLNAPAMFDFGGFLCVDDVIKCT
jgi:hypothetical protein